MVDYKRVQEEGKGRRWMPNGEVLGREDTARMGQELTTIFRLLLSVSIIVMSESRSNLPFSNPKFDPCNKTLNSGTFHDNGQLSWEPSWLSDKDKVLLQNSKQKLKPDVVVASDGSGRYKTIGEAVRVAPSRSNKRFVIYVKKGIYRENVNVEDDKWNVMIYGDGIGKTIVSNNLSIGDRLSTAKTSTFAAFGKGFIAMDMEFQNTAGPTKGQAVALQSSSDQSVFFRCRIAGYQDTLYTRYGRQFYRECQILGTIDFIFGTAAAIIQNSAILVRRPNPQKVTIITAQGKETPQTNSGLSIQNCTIDAAENLKGIKTYLGRPWKDHSTTVIMGSRLGSLIDPEGWLPWNGQPPPDTVLYIEYNNRGPGANIARRVKWKGVKVVNTKDAADKFTVKNFIDGGRWLPLTTVPFYGGL
ncbi:probable pectinesterase/pectinesterase inhibitor 46 [Andrographis paniculata]|uniref:probable pectinesterase/pectinesterase inhibitor 46 n=1 Tax=Andrographis paniculata TaxID=175694 RepID=UPI0021E83BD5|nr:probable pectinesterase/pectinesterase inhibitor 46 [Andrographis paniculata]